MLEHVAERLPQQVQVVIGKAAFFRQRDGNKALHTIQAVRHDELAAHGALFFQVFFIGHGHTRDAHFGRDHGFHAAGKGQLHRAAYLAAVHFRGHDGSEGADVEKILAHPGRDGTGVFRLFGQFFGFRLQ